MKKVTIAFVIALILGAGLPVHCAAQNWQQEQIQDPSQPAAPASTKAWERGHRQYFPGTVYNDGPPEPGVAGRFHRHVNRRMGDFTSHFNPCDADYGNQLAQWRRQMVDETVRNAIFWIAAGELIVLLILTLYVMYLLRQREQRLWIAADITCQLYNSWAVASNKAKTVIAEHNRWMQQLNEDYEASLREGGEEERPRLDPIEPVEKAPRGPKYLDDKPAAQPPHAEPVPETPAPLEVSDGEPALDIGPAILSVRAAKFDDGFRGSQAPRHSANGDAPDTDQLLAELNGNAMSQAEAANAAMELEKQKAKAKALEQQNAALKKMLNTRRSDEAASAADPIRNGDME